MKVTKKNSLQNSTVTRLKDLKETFKKDAKPIREIPFVQLVI